MNAQSDNTQDTEILTLDGSVEETHHQLPSIEPETSPPSRPVGEAQSPAEPGGETAPPQAPRQAVGSPLPRPRRLEDDRNRFDTEAFGALAQLKLKQERLRRQSSAEEGSSVLRERLMVARDKGVQLEQEKSQLEQKLRQLQRELETMRQEIHYVREEAQARETELNRTLDALHQEIASSAAQDYAARLETAGAENAALRKTLDEKEVQLREAAQRDLRLEKDIEKLLLQRRPFEQEILQLQTALDQAQANLAQAEKAQQVAEETYQTLQSEFEKRFAREAIEIPSQHPERRRFGSLFFVVVSGGLGILLGLTGARFLGTDYPVPGSKGALTGNQPGSKELSPPPLPSPLPGVPPRPTASPTPIPTPQVEKTAAATPAPSETQESNSLPPPSHKVVSDSLRNSGGRGPEMQYIPAGGFTMGDDHDALAPEEQPIHQVRIRPFYMARHEVSFADYDRFARATGRGLPDDKGWGRGSRPVINVSWQEARAYANWLTQESGHKYRLPSEAEWEYAAKAGSLSLYWWGSRSGENNANCFNCGSQWDNRSTAPVGSFKPNAFGLYDVAGNVSEWVEDCFHSSYQGAPLDGSAWADPDCNERVVRGGAFSRPADAMRSTRRGAFDQNVRLEMLGFRVVREP